MKTKFVLEVKTDGKVFRIGGNSKEVYELMGSNPVDPNFKELVQEFIINYFDKNGKN